MRTLLIGQNHTSWLDAKMCDKPHLYCGHRQLPHQKIGDEYHFDLLEYMDDDPTTWAYDMAMALIQPGYIVDVEMLRRHRDIIACIILFGWHLKTTHALVLHVLKQPPRRIFEMIVLQPYQDDAVRTYVHNVGRDFLNLKDHQQVHDFQLLCDVVLPYPMGTRPANLICPVACDDMRNIRVAHVVGRRLGVEVIHDVDAFVDVDQFEHLSVVVPSYRAAEKTYGLGVLDSFDRCLLFDEDELAWPKFVKNAFLRCLMRPKANFELGHLCLEHKKATWVDHA